MPTRAEFSHLIGLDDCQLCDPETPGQLPNKALVEVKFVWKGYVLKVCVTCLEAGIPREFVLEPPALA